MLNIYVLCNKHGSQSAERLTCVVVPPVHCTVLAKMTNASSFVICQLPCFPPVRSRNSVSTVVGSEVKVVVPPPPQLICGVRILVLKTGKYRQKKTCSLSHLEFWKRKSWPLYKKRPKNVSMAKKLSGFQTFANRNIFRNVTFLKVLILNFNKMECLSTSRMLSSRWSPNPSRWLPPSGHNISDNMKLGISLTKCPSN